MKGKKYKIIYADPPWKYDRRVGQGIAENHYHTMSVEEICALPVKSIADDNCILFLWVTFPCLLEGLSVMESWGFAYQTCGFNWVKRNKKADTFYFGLGFWTRTCSEICIIGTKGRPQRVSKNVSQICDARIMEHSKKPDEIRNRIVELCGDIPRIELFARQSYEGWDCLGDEIDGKDIQETIREL